MNHPDKLWAELPRGIRGQVLAFGIVGWAFMSWVAVPASLMAEETDRAGLHEPVYRVSTASKGLDESLDVKPVPHAAEEVVGTDASAQGHPLDQALSRARASLENIEANIRDYTCTLVKREQIGGELQDHEFMSCKIRHGRKVDGHEVPFGVYLSFHKPEAMKGREVIYVAGLNEDKLIAHEGGFKGRLLPTVYLLPTSTLAQRGNRYPITEIGIETLTRRLIEKGERDRLAGTCDVRMVEGAKVKGRVCTMLEVRHVTQKTCYDFHLARIFMDDELNLPIRYEAYDWPAEPSGAPVLLEEYTYMDLKINVGLTDADFDSTNPQYRF